MKFENQNLETQKNAARAAWNAAYLVRLAWFAPLRPHLLLLVFAFMSVSAWYNGVGLDGLRFQVDVAWFLLFIFLPLGFIFAKNGGETTDPLGAAFVSIATPPPFIFCWPVRPILFLEFLVSFVSFLSAPPAAPPRAHLAG